MGLVKAVIFDWAGTVIDYGSLAPMGAFVETFGEFGVTISPEEARAPMGMAKRPHIAAIMMLPRVAEAWAKRHGHAPTDGRRLSCFTRRFSTLRSGRLGA
jgi:phosphonoacetaldehyde hydrolase